MTKQHLPELTFTIQVFEEGGAYVSYNPELDVSSCGATPQEARYNLKDALTGFLEAAAEEQTLDHILEEAGYVRTDNTWTDPHLVILDRVSLPA